VGVLAPTSQIVFGSRLLQQLLQRKEENAFVSPGIVLRCPACQAAIARIVDTPTAIYIEARGATFLRLPR
jgi:hypothetical protein